MFGNNKAKAAEPPKAEPQDANAANGNATPGQSGLRALVAVARHMGLDWSLTRLQHLYARDREPDAQELVRVARAEGLKADRHKANWKEMSRSQKLTPFLARLNTGVWFVVVKVGEAA